VVVHVGDGVIGAVEAGVPQVLSGPDRGQYANETTFVTCGLARKRARMAVLEISPLTTSFVLMTDGPQAVLYDSRTCALSQTVEQMASWLDRGSEAEVSQGIGNTIRKHLLPATHDDCTVAVIRRATSLSRFACPACGRWVLERARAGTRWFCIQCSTCREIVARERMRGRRYPPLAREWMIHLVCKLGVLPSGASAIAEVSMTTVRRWSVDYVRRAQREGVS
jgi:predicted RNA-binding Zn-ribbon protein involved in translation (DUF1610 family)